jgi:hypothetical protein
VSEAEAQDWYSVRCIFKAGDRSAYEERITLWRADSIDDAIRLAEIEASEYGGDVGWSYVGLAQAYELKAESVGNGSEVFSLIRNSSLQAIEYLDRFFDTGTEVQRKG